VLEVSRSGFYAWIVRPESARDAQDRALGTRIEKIHEKSRGTYGSPRVHAKLAQEGIRCGRKRIARVMRDRSLRSKVRRKFRATTDSNHSFPVAKNLLQQNFFASEPNRVWVVDITYIWTLEGWLYLASILDLCSRMIVGWCLDMTMTRQLVLNALENAVGRRNVRPGLIHHSDRGSQYASSEYQNALRKHGMISSMSRRGNCYDNAAKESFFHTLKTELTYHVQFRTRAEARSAIFEFIEVFYNRERLHSSIGYQTPAAFERSQGLAG
jgi:putative transposase